MSLIYRLADTIGPVPFALLVHVAAWLILYPIVVISGWIEQILDDLKYRKYSD